MEVLPLFELPPVAVKFLRDACRTFHGIWHENKITGNMLEELVARSLDYDPVLNAHVRWKSHSHNPRADIYLETPERTLGISIKSGNAEKGRLRDMVTISGHRLGGAWGDINKINAMLRERVSDVVICFLHTPKQRCYESLYIDAPVFQYPTTADGWSAKVGNRNGRIAELVYVSEAGLRCSIKNRLSSQIWWTIPRTLCRQGPIIPYGL